MVAVERHADASRVHELDAARPGALELQVCVAEDDALGLHAHQPLGVRVLRLGVEAVHVGERRGVAEERALAGGGLGQGGELPAQLLAGHLAGAIDQRLHRLGRVGRVDEPAVDVAADPLGVELAEAADGLDRPGAEAGVVAAEEEPLRRAVREHRLERGQVAVHVVQQAQHGRDAT